MNDQNDIGSKDRNSDVGYAEIRAHDFDEQKSYLLPSIIVVFLLVVAGLGVYFRQPLSMALLSKSQPTGKNAYLAGLSSKFQLSGELPNWVLSQQPLLVSLDRLDREPCDKIALSSAGEKIAEGGYPRDASDLLLKLGKKCKNDDAIYQAANTLENISDFRAVVRVTSELIESSPSSSTLRYMRANALKADEQYAQAIADYVSTIELVGSPKNVSSSVFLALSSSYAALGRFCEAMTPVQMWTAMDPSNRDTTQSRRIVAEYETKGSCKGNYATGSGRFFSAGQGTMQATVEIDGTKGLFIVDTGASLLSIDRGFARKIGLQLDETNTIQLSTANGSTDGILAVAKTVKMGNLQASDVAMVVGKTAFGDGIDGLLGMSFLARYEMTISGRELILKQRKL